MNMVVILNVQSLGKGKRPPTESEGPPNPNCRPAIYAHLWTIIPKMGSHNHVSLEYLI